MALPTQAQLYEEVDRQFFAAHPDAPPRLDPDDAGQASLVRDWLERRDTILNEWVDEIFAGFFPHAGKLDPDDPGDSTLIEYWLDIRDAIRDGTPSRYNWDQPPATSGSTDTSATATTATPSTAADGSDTAPQVPAEIDESQFKEYVHGALEGTHYIGGTSEVLAWAGRIAGASEEAGIVVLGEVLGPIGTIAATIVLLWAVVHAFGTGLRLQEQEGFCYGLMWEAFSMPNGSKQFLPWFDDSAEDLHDAFYEGVAAGREKAGDTVVHNKIMLAVAYYQGRGSDLSWSQYYVLNELWQHVRETDKGRDTLDWPKPADMQPIF